MRAYRPKTAQKMMIESYRQTRTRRTKIVTVEPKIVVTSGIEKDKAFQAPYDQKSKQRELKETLRQTDFVSPRAPDGANNKIRFRQKYHSSTT